MAGRLLPFQLGQSSQVIKNSTGWAAAAIAGDNPTPGYIHLPGLPPGLQWVFPYTYGFSYPILPPSLAPITATTKDTPAGFPVAPAYTTLASLALFEDPMPYSAGRTAAPAQQWVKVGSKTLAAGADTLVTDVVPPTTKSLAIDVGPSSNILVTGSAWLQGNQSSTRYGGGGPNGTIALSGQVMVPANGQLDSTYTLTVSAGNGQTVAIYATDALAPTVSQGSLGSSRAAPVQLAWDQQFGYQSGVLRQGFPVVTYIYDGQAFAHPAAATKATVTLAANASQKWIAHLFKAGAFNTTNATATHLDAVLVDGVSGGAALLDSIPMQLAAAASTVASNSSGNTVGGAEGNAAINTALTAEFNAAPPAGAAEVVTLGAYLQ